MIKLSNARNLYCDVDDTLIIWDPEKFSHSSTDLLTIEDNKQSFKFLPHHRHIDFLRKVKLQGYGIVVWSKAGADWAEKIVLALGLEDVVDVVASKPEFVLDDLKSQKEIIGQILYIHPDTGEFERN